MSEFVRKSLRNPDGKTYRIPLSRFRETRYLTINGHTDMLGDAASYIGYLEDIITELIAEHSIAVDEIIRIKEKEKYGF